MALPPEDTLKIGVDTMLPRTGPERFAAEMRPLIEDLMA